MTRADIIWCGGWGGSGCRVSGDRYTINLTTNLTIDKKQFDHQIDHQYDHYYEIHFEIQTIHPFFNQFCPPRGRRRRPP